jgi:hypothetical protein
MPLYCYIIVRMKLVLLLSLCLLTAKAVANSHFGYSIVPDLSPLERSTSIGWIGLQLETDPKIWSNLEKLEFRSNPKTEDPSLLFLVKTSGYGSGPSDSVLHYDRLDELVVSVSGVPETGGLAAGAFVAAIVLLTARRRIT